MKDLRTRLAHLNGGRTSPAAPLPPPLADRIARLRTRSAEIKARRPTDPTLAAELGGDVLAPALVEVVRSFPLPLGHGATRISAAADLASGVRLSATDDVRCAPDGLLLLDTETSGLAGGSGTVAFLVGLASVRDETLVVRQLLMTGFAGERPMLDGVLASLARAQCIVTFNGKSFDLPLLRARTRLASLAWPEAMPDHLDLLHVTRRRLREGWPDCRLRTAEENALGFERADDLPGAEVPAAWQRWLQRGDAAALPKILDHNREDLLSLAGLLAVLARPTPREAPLLHAPRGHGSPASAPLAP
jgi:uncharacterized protein YprB with RNaseH-like and TPR domain